MSLQILCPHGDVTCPCQDGDACHYEGVDPMACPNPPMPCPHPHPPVRLEDGRVIHVGETNSHCHVEGCGWDQQPCGLGRLGLPISLPSSPDPTVEEVEAAIDRIEMRIPPSSPWWRCGASRAAEWLWFDDPQPWHQTEETA